MTPLVFALVAAAAAATASAPAIVGPTLDVGGAVALTEEGQLEVRVDLTNRGDAASGAVSVVGELAGHYDEVRVPAAAAAAGVTPAARSQRAFLLLSLGATAAAPVRIRAPEVTLRDRVLLPVALESADGRAHLIRLRVLSPRGLNPEHLQDEVTVPAAGTATVSVPLLRGGVPRPSRQGLLLVAETLDGDVAQASTSTSLVAVEAAADPRPKWRDPFVVAAGLLLAAAAVLEWRHVRRLRQATADPAA
ncbi:MAG: hypothetical protein DMF77_20650 [Acidobacteria bacterium]|nr:MAG: hypothetical protein DMF77_20650 [Acidobacteriota bacterium]